MFNIDPVAFEIFGFAINWYGLIIAAGALLCIVLALLRCKQTGFSQDTLIDFAIFVIPAGLIGARLYYVIFAWDYFKDNLLSVFDIRSGGLAIYGAVIAGVITAIIFCKVRKLKLGTILDLVAPGLILAQGIGRWGNFFNQEAYGYAESNPALQFFPLAIYINDVGQWHYATFFYESVWCILGFVLLWWYQNKSTRPGHVFTLYLMVYGLERFFVEGFRTDSLYLFGTNTITQRGYALLIDSNGIRVSQLLSLVLVIGAAIYFFSYLRKKKIDAPVASIESVDPSLKIVSGDISVRDEDIAAAPAEAEATESEETADEAAFVEELPDNDENVFYGAVDYQEAELEETDYHDSDALADENK